MTLNKDGLEAAHAAYERYGQNGDLRSQRLSDGCLSTVITAYLKVVDERLSAAEQQVRDMRAGLEPFAEFAKVRDDNDPDMPDRMVVAAYATDLRGNAVRITLGDLRRARLLLKEGGE